MSPFLGLAPMLMTRDLPRTIEFYTTILGFKIDGKWPDDKPCWCSMTNGFVRLMFQTPEMYREKEPKLTGRLYIYTDDVMAIYDAIKERVKVIEGPEVYFYKMKEIAIEDCNGYVLTFGQDTDEPPTCNESPD